jgi:hypothetical protein
MNDDYDNARTDREMLERYASDEPLLTNEERKLRARACRGFSQRQLDMGEISAIRAFLTGNSDECPLEYREAYRAEQERAARGGRNVYVYRLVVEYPEGSRETGWEPAFYRDKDWRRQLSLRHRIRFAAGGGMRFRWPRERMFLSSDKAWGRAHWLTACGARVTILRSEPVTWFETQLEEFAGIRSNW